MVGQHRESVQYGGAGTTHSAASPIETVVPTQTSGGFSGYDNQDFKRTVIKGDLTHYCGGSHTLKGGGDLRGRQRDGRSLSGRRGPANLQADLRGHDLLSPSLLRQRSDSPNFNRNDPSTWQINLPLEAKPITHNASLYAQDSYKPLSNLTINYGLRWESQHVIGRDPTAGFQINNEFAPRVGAIWDPTNTGKSKVYFNYGRFYENIPQDINIRAFGGELTAFSYNFSPDAVELPAGCRHARQEHAAWADPSRLTRA